MDIKFDDRNYRIHNEQNKELIKKSLEECGAGRSIIIDSEDEIIGGNGVYEQAKALNMPIKVIETDGSELVVVKRTDLKTDDDKRKRLAVMDNSTSDTSSFDVELLSKDFDNMELVEMGIDIIEPKDDKTYTSVVNIPQYEVENANVTVSDLYNDSKTRELLEEIEQSDLPEEEKLFLTKASYRHCEFNYRNIAEYYAKASPECQKLMEKSALIIIDYDDALKNGYTTLSKKMGDEI